MPGKRSHGRQEDQTVMMDANYDLSPPDSNVVALVVFSGYSLA
jgi:hypothetical protein